MPMVIAHRGASGEAYENSSAAFRRAVELGADGVELDIHATQDGTLLVHHDAEVKGLGRIPDLPATAFARHRLPNGEPIPTLAEALSILGGLEVWVEVKTLPAAWDQRLFETLDQGPAPDKYGVHAFDHRIIDRLGEQRPELRRGILLASYLMDNLAALRGVGADTLWMETDLIDAPLVEELHRDERQIIGWTANDALEIRRLASLNVDGICGNYPDRIRAALS